MLKGHISWEWYEKCLAYHCDRYPEWWQTMVSEWEDPRNEDTFWMIGSSSYVFRTDGFLWAVDPVWLLPGVLEKIGNRLPQDMSRFRFIVFTHEHGDHFSPECVRLLKDIDVTWIVPECMENYFFGSTDVPREKAIVMKPGDCFDFDTMHLKAYLGHHHYFGGSEGPESLMYTAKTSRKNLFFPADLRDFSPSFIPAGKYDDVFLHLYFSRENGTDYPFRDYYAPLTQFAAALDTDRIYLGHLWGFQCQNPDLIWNGMHAGMLADGLFCLRPEIDVQVPKIGKHYPL